MQPAIPSTNSTFTTDEAASRTAAKRYHTPSFTRLGKVEELTGQTTRPTTTRPPTRTPIPTATPNKNGSAS